MANKIYRSTYTAEQMQSAMGKTPVIRNGYWYLWDIASMQYVTSGVAVDTAVYAQQSKESAEAAATSASNAADSETASKQAAAIAKSSGTLALDSAARAEAAATRAEAAVVNPPYIGENGNWWVYDPATEQFTDSGIDASITVEIADVTMIGTTEAPRVSNSGTNTDPVFHLFLPSAKSISSIAKTGTDQYIDTYTITYSDGTASTYSVANGTEGPQGPRGPQGERGMNGVAVSASGQYAFNVDDRGHLILTYTEDPAPDFQINEDGHLILNI